MKDLLSNLFSQQLIAALADTLIYSLLAGVILAVVAGCVVIFTRKASAAIRYNCLTGALALFAAVMVVIFIGQYQAADKFYSTVNLLPNDTAFTGPITYPQYAGHSVATNSDYLTVIKSYLDQNHNTIVLIWLLVISIRSIQLMVGLQGVYRLRNKGTGAVNDVWADAFDQTIERLKIKQGVRILTSTLTRVPMAVGHLRPLVLIPIGLMTALSTAEIEAILLHELAHIRRRDYLVNLLQNVLEIIFFFNPAVLWVSRLMRDERENCCDDLALAHNSSRAQYIRALVNCEELSADSGAYAMALSGHKNGLVGRVKRLMSKQNYSLDPFEKTLITICLIVAGVGFSAYAGKETIARAAKAVVKAMTTEEAPIVLEPIKGEKRLRPIIMPAVIDTIVEVDPRDPLTFKDTVIGKNFKVKVKMEDTLKVVEISQQNYVAYGPRKNDKDSSLNQRYQTYLARLKKQRAPLPADVIDTDADSWYDNKIQQARNAQAPTKDLIRRGISGDRTTTIAASSLKGEANKYNALQFLVASGQEYYDYRLDRGKKITDTLTHIPLTQRDYIAFELAKDGLIETDETSMADYRWTYVGDGLAINGTPLSADMSKKYRGLISRRTNNPKFLADAHNEGYHVSNRIILELVNDGLVAKDDEAIGKLVFSLDEKALTVNGKQQSAKIFKKYYTTFVKPAANGRIAWSYGEATK
ncbi:M56 family metallopeptidase [Mucilaginibacter myungsuensis]|uniref:M56 family metallopeptidase n=1 Tax=Mucilaginibacter myungsuensis TaxID=649104 RepID=A0A929KY75_9SPHI|nr:M56 family metallopeptidase [Mucilaginibacter myungsuensis]MBE9662837.1 M56 family metallopeptidase [Mucilaginibacter myungsuensis]MDN3598257.1 M56 family metallopeptidase [Mucilaginibacter myungsuensis]